MELKEIVLLIEALAMTAQQIPKLKELFDKQIQNTDLPPDQLAALTQRVTVASNSVTTWE
jgi:hypothetical protein